MRSGTGDATSVSAREGRGHASADRSRGLRPIRDEEASADPGVQGTRRFLELLAASFQVTATAVQTVAEGYNGFAMALVMADPRGVCPSRIVRC